jgi:hypothetical protein
MVAKAVLVQEVTITILAVLVFAAIGVVLLPRLEARQVAVAVVAWPVGIRIFFVLLQGPVVRERSITAIAIRH